MTGLSRWLERVAPSRAHGSVSIALVSDAQIRSLNRRYRKVDRATDVLSFVGGSAVSTPPATGLRSSSFGQARRSAKGAEAASHQPPHLGDIAIARGIARRQAREAGHSELTELRVLALHGLLHLLGYDHEGDNGLMGRAEARLRRRGGLAAGLIERQR